MVKRIITPERKAYEQKYYQDHKDKFREQLRKWRAENRDKTRQYKLKGRYGITPEEYQKMHDEQDGVCAICKQPETLLHQNGNIRRLVVDHNHETDEVRALLCTKCNLMVGNSLDNPELLEKAAAYLREFIRFEG